MRARRGGLGRAASRVCAVWRRSKACFRRTTQLSSSAPTTRRWALSTRPASRYSRASSCWYERSAPHTHCGFQNLLIAILNTAYGDALAESGERHWAIIQYRHTVDMTNTKRSAWERAQLRAFRRGADLAALLVSTPFACVERWVQAKTVRVAATKWSRMWRRCRSKQGQPEKPAKSHHTRKATLIHTV